MRITENPEEKYMCSDISDVKYYLENNHMSSLQLSIKKSFLLFLFLQVPIDT